MKIKIFDWQLTISIENVSIDKTIDTLILSGKCVQAIRELRIYRQKSGGDWSPKSCHTDIKNRQHYLIGRE